MIVSSRSRLAAAAIALLAFITGLSHGRNGVGTFTPNLPSLPGGMVWNVAYNPTSVVLSVGGGAAGADLSIVKDDTPDPVNAGASLAYTLTVTNAGPDPATSVTVTDTLPAGLTGVTGSGTGWTCPDPVAGVLTCTRPSLDVTTAPVILVTGTAPASGPLSNTASVSSATVDPIPGNNSDTEDTTVTPVAESSDLSILKADSPDPVNAGATLTYTLTITNTGPDVATDLTVADQLPAGLTNVVGSGSEWTCGPPVAGILSCTRPSLAVTTAPVITITATAPASGPLSNTAAVVSTTPDPNMSNNSDTEGTTVTPAAQSADLSIVEADSPDPVGAGGSLTYLLAVTNDGPNSATSISVADMLPAGLTNVSATGNGWTCGAPVSGVLTCTRPSLGVATAPLITILATAPAGGPLSNTAAVSSFTADPNTANNSDTEGTTVTGGTGGGADLSITTGDSLDPVEAGQAITWTLDVSNAGPATATGLFVTDTLPPGVSQARVTGDGWNCRPTVTTVACQRAVLAVGPAPTITITAIAPGTAGVITNQADVVADTIDPVLANNAVEEDTTVSPVHDIGVLKVKAPAKVKLGGSTTSITARIKVQIQNRSPNDETIVDEGMLANLVHVAADSLGACADVQGTVLDGSPQPGFPRTLHSKQKLVVWFEVAFSSACINDPAKSSSSDPGHEDYQLLVSLDHAALDGQSDTHPADDVCPRSVTPPFVIDRYPDGSIKDKGCGKQKADGTFGYPVLVDVWLRE